MSKEMVISSNRHETRVALLEDDQLCEVYFQRANEYSLAGSIHKGRVTRVLPGMQSAFVDLGLERDTFLYVSDFLEDHEDFDQVTGDERPERSERSESRSERGGDRGGDRGDRGDRGGRDRGGRDRDRDSHRGERRQALPPSLTAAAPPPPAEGAAPATEASAPEAEPSAVAAPSPAGESAPRDDRGGDRGDRRGRRSRRRRNRGRGFPESKYADPNAPAGAPASEGESESGNEADEPEESDVIEAVEAAPSQQERVVLPGESLAKYRGTAMPPPLPAEAFTRPASAPAAEPAATEESEYDEPIHYPPDNTLPDAPAHGEPIAEAPSPHQQATVIAAPPAAPPQADAEEKEEAEEAADSGPAVAPLLDEDEDLDIQAMILDAIEGVDEDAAGAAESDAAESEEDGEEQIEDQSEDQSDESPEETRALALEPGVEAPPVDAAAADGAPESGSAEVRERGGRFPHRISRRRRRGGRGPAGEAREGREPRAGEPRGEDGAPAAPRSPEERTVSRPEGGRPEGGRPEGGRGPRPERTGGNTPAVSITDMLKEGQEIIVQIAKEPLGQKGARITSHIALPGRYVVYMPTLEHMGVSRKISSDEERLRLKRILKERKPGTVGGFITRTAAEGRTEEEIAADMEFLYKLWQDIKTKAERKPAPLLLHHDLDIVQRVLRDQLTDNFKSIWIDNEELYESVVSFVQRFQPALVGKVKLYTREAPIFDSFNITSELEKALRPKVWLKSGGYIVINQTEALVAIDVNTGKYVGKSNRLEDTIVKTNTEAIKEIVRQIRLRDLGGIIVIDFIDMDERKNRQKVMQALEEAMRADRAPYKILQFNDFGLVAITRKRVKQSLERTLCSPCPHCDGSGSIKSVQTVVSEILTEARKMSSSVEGKDVMLRVHPDVAKILKSHQNKYLEELEEVLRRPVIVKSDPLLHHEKFDLA
ncbi:MAG TPA: Rne/Rng family ribonuclease [Bryobacteraceae bacterium]|jgi:ribonuclease G